MPVMAALLIANVAMGIMTVRRRSSTCSRLVFR